MANRHPVGTQKSRQAHVVAGTLRQKDHATLRSPEPTPGAPDPPEALDDDYAAREWARLMWSFEDMGMLHKVDAHAVYQYCNLFAETERIRAQQVEHEAALDILNENIRGVSKEDVVQLFAQIVILRKLVSKCTDQLRNGRNTLRLFLVEFGLTPSSRGRIKLPPLAAPVVDDFAAMQQQHRRRAAS